MSDNEKKRPSPDDVIILVPPMSDDMDSDKEANDYIEKILANAQDSIEQAKREQEEEERAKAETDAECDADEMEEIDESEIDMVSIEKLMEDDASMEAKTNVNSEKALRALTGIEKILIGILMLLPGIQLLLMFAVPALPYFIYSLISLVFVILLSHGCKQYSMVFVHIAMMAMSLFIVISGFDYGMISDDLSKRSVLKISYLNSNTPTMMDYDDMTEEEIFDEFYGKFIYLYKYGCSDCTAIDSQMDALFEVNGYDLVAIETRSDIGKKMIDLFPVEEVPAGVILHADGTHTKRVLHTVENDEIVISKQKLADLLNALEKELGKNATE